MSKRSKSSHRKPRTSRARSLKLSSSGPKSAPLVVNREAFLRAGGSGGEQAIKLPSDEALRNDISPDSLSVRLAALTGQYASDCRDLVEDHIARVLKSNGTV